MGLPPTIHVLLPCGTDTQSTGWARALDLWFGLAHLANRKTQPTQQIDHPGFTAREETDPEKTDPEPEWSIQ
jgi:hypothetical protein